ncbi:hypothetical protein ACFSCZ_16210, partial [Siminovitchia sediminis]
DRSRWMGIFFLKIKTQKSRYKSSKCKIKKPVEKKTYTFSTSWASPTGLAFSFSMGRKKGKLNEDVNRRAGNVS